MPTYDYECRLCGHAFEQFQTLSERKRRKCPSCGRPGLERLIGTGAGIVFKGSGFYETDYKRAGSKRKDEQDSAGKGDAGKGTGDGTKSTGDGTSGPSTSDAAAASSGTGTRSSATPSRRGPKGTPPD